MATNKNPFQSPPDGIYENLTHYGEYWQSKANGEWYFHIKGKNHRVTSGSESYKEKRKALRTVHQMGFKARRIEDPNTGIV